MKEKWLLLVVLAGLGFGIGSLIVFVKEARWPLFASDQLVASTSNTYLGPKKPQVGNPQLVQVQILIRDSLDPSGVQIVSAEFDKKSIPLQPRDIYGNRASAAFQVTPGKYVLKWKVNRDKRIWPRTLTHEEEVDVSSRDLWLQITVDGETASLR